MQRKIVVLFSFLLLSIKLAPAQEMKGLSFVGTRHHVNQDQIFEVQKTAANWVALMPFGYMRSIDNPSVFFNMDWQWRGETKAGVEDTAKLFLNEGISVMLKPQIWIKNGEFTGTITFQTKTDWNLFLASYKKFILHFAQLAETLNLPLLCIGTELQTIVEYSPNYWHELIKEIRLIYKGKLTYAENWDQYHNVPFWNDLDYIGIDAYFPLKTTEPSVNTLIDLWQPYVNTLELYSKTQKRPIIFTEMGYRSVNQPTIRPWDYSNRDLPYNGQSQADALEALFLSFADKPWWKGGFIWKWFPNHQNTGGVSNSGFTPQNKPAQKVIQRYFTKRE